MAERPRTQDSCWCSKLATKKVTVTSAMRVQWRNVPLKIVVRAASTAGNLVVSWFQSVSVSVCGEPVRATLCFKKAVQFASTMRGECWDMCVLATDLDFEEMSSGPNRQSSLDCLS